MRFGGCRCDASLPGSTGSTGCRAFPKFLDEFEALLSENEVLVSRSQGVGALSQSLAIDADITGPMLRATGVNLDLRKAEPYGIYDRFEFRIPLGDHGDVFDRYMIRILEMRESVSILRQAIGDIPQGDFIHPKAKLRGFKPPAGDLWTHRGTQGRTGLLPHQRW